MPRDLKSSADAILDDAVASGAIAGVSAMAMTPTSVAYEGASGVSALGANEQMTADTVCWIASMTKPLAGIAAVQLIERGVLELDEPARAAAPVLSNVQVLEGFDEDGAPRLRAPKREVTLRDLLTHTSGFGYELFSATQMQLQAALGLPGIAEGKRALLSTPLLFDPGERWEYGLSSDVVGCVVEAASGQTLGAYLKENVFEPLGMSSTAFTPTPEMRARLAGMHVRTPDGGIAPFPFESVVAEFETGGGGLYSTTRDYSRFVQAILAGGAPILGSTGMKLVSENLIGGIRVTPLKSTTPFSMDAEIFPGVPKAWTGAFQINLEAASTGRSAGGLMWAGLSNCYFWIDLTAKIGGVTMAQLVPFADPRAMQVWLDFETEVYKSAL